MQLKDNIGYLLNHLAFVLSRQSDQVLQEQLGIGMSQFKIMMVLQWNPHIQQRIIADKLGQTEASVSRQIKLLLDKRLLISSIREENRREHITELTPKGERLLEKAQDILNRYHEPTFAALSNKQRLQFLEVLNALHDRACSGNKTGSCQHATN